MKLRNIFFINYSGCREITEFSIDQNDFTVKGTSIYFQTIEQPGSLYPVTVARYLNLKVFPYSNMILNG
jgi:hypothetical protein